GQGYASGLAGIATDFGITVEEPAPQPTPQPPAPPVRQAPPPAYHKPAAPVAGKINLDKGKVNLQKGQSVSLVKTGAPPLTRIRMGLGWAAGTGRSIDLDASAILYDARGKDVDKVWFMSQKGAGGAVQHSGDNLVGGGGGDDEQIS